MPVMAAQIAAASLASFFWPSRTASLLRGNTAPMTIACSCGPMMRATTSFHATSHGGSSRKKGNNCARRTGLRTMLDRTIHGMHLNTCFAKSKQHE